MKLSDYPVHNMDEMVQYFRDRGIDVKKFYNASRGFYEFTLRKGDVCTMYVFVYPLTDDYERKCKEMSRACEKMLQAFNEHVGSLIRISPEKFKKIPDVVGDARKAELNKLYGSEFNDYADADIRSIQELYPSTMIVPRQLAPEKVYFNNPVTVVIWNDGTKTIVRCSENDIYDPEKGLAMAFCKKMFGNDNTFKKHFKKWLPEESESVQFAKLGERVSEGLQAGIADIRADEFADRLAKSIKESLDRLGVDCWTRKRV